MKIIIAGAGAVGTHLAKLLSDEKQDIILMDENEEKLSKLDSNFDLMTVNASPTSISGLKNAGVAGADLFIGVMPEESRNMTACMLATNMGAKKTVARIDNYEYLLPKHKEFFSQLGVHSLIYPEMLAAKDIVDAIKMSWIRQWWEFCGGALVLIGTKMRETAEILNVPLHELGGRNIPFHIVAIKRGNETIIPRGDDVIKLHDIVYFTTTKKYIPYIRKITGKENYPDVRNVMIMGGSRIAVRTTQYVPDYMQVKIIENDINRCNRLTEVVDDKVMIINGDGRDMDLLMEEGLKNTEAFVALTDNSETNILACLAAKRMGVTKTVAEVENIDYISMAESLDITFTYEQAQKTFLHPYQTVKIFCEGEELGYFGKLAYDIQNELNMRTGAFVLEMDLERLSKWYDKKRVFKALSRFPEEKRDLAFVMNKDITFGQVEECIKRANKYIKEIRLFDVYEGGQIPEGKKSMAYTITFAPKDEALDAETVQKFVDKICRTLKNDLDIDLRA